MPEVRLLHQQGHGKAGHIGDGVLEAADHEDEDAPEDHDELAGFGLHLEGAPHGQTHQHVAQDPPHQHLRHGQKELCPGQGGDIGGGSPRHKAGGVVEGGRQPGAGVVGQPAEEPQLHGVHRLDPPLQHPGGHHQVVAGKKLAAGHDHKTQGRGEGKGRRQLRPGALRRLEHASHRGGDKAAEGHEHPRQHPGEEIPHRRAAHEGELALRRGNHRVIGFPKHMTAPFSRFCGAAFGRVWPRFARPCPRARFDSVYYTPCFSNCHSFFT